MQLTNLDFRPRLPALAAALVLTTSHFAHGAVLVSNLDEPRRDATLIQQDPDLAADPQVLFPWAAQSFTTDANAYVLASIDVLLGTLVDDPTIVAELRSEDGLAAPGALITTLTVGPISPGPATLESLMPSTTVNLAPATTYWLVLGALGVGSYTFDYAEGNGMTGPGSLASYAYSDDRGNSWTNFGADNPYKLRVNVAATNVDAPGVLALLSTGMLALGWMRRRTHVS